MPDMHLTEIAGMVFAAVTDMPFAEIADMLLAVVTDMPFSEMADMLFTAADMFFSGTVDSRANDNEIPMDSLKR